MKIDLGCGSKKKEGFTGVDIQKLPGVDVVVNIGKEKLPFKDNSVEEMYSNECLCYVDDLEFILKEIYRVCKPKAKIHFILPHFSSIRAFHLFNKHFFRSIDFFKFRKGDHWNPVPEISFNVEKVFIEFDKGFQLWNYILEPLININHWTRRFYESTFLRMFPAKDIHYWLEVVK